MNRTTLCTIIESIGASMCPLCDTLLIFLRQYWLIEDYLLTAQKSIQLFSLLELCCCHVLQILKSLDVWLCYGPLLLSCLL